MPETRNVSANYLSTFSNTSRSDGDAETGSQAPKALLRASTTFYERVITDWWWWELGSWLVSFACVSTIIGLLLYYDGKPQPNHVIKGITLNAFIAVFAAVAKAALILPVSEAIGQLKWIWFRSEKRLFDFYVFDNASRGPWGSAMLLCRTKGRHLVSIGAVITVLALAFEPFFQQSVSFPSRTVITGSGTVSVATSYSLQPSAYRDTQFDLWNTAAVGTPERTLATRISEAVSDRNGTIKVAPSVCPTGQCTWQSYASLGVCLRCQDISNLLEYVCQADPLNGPSTKGRYQYPCGYRLNQTLVTGTWGSLFKNALVFSTMLVGSKVGSLAHPLYWNSTAFRNASNVILDFYIGFVPGGEPQMLRNATPVLLECVYQWCVRNYEASHRDGRLQEKVLSTYLPTNSGSDRSTPNDAFIMNAAGGAFSVGANATSSLSNSIAANLPMTLSNTTLDGSGQFHGNWDFVQNAPYDFNRALAPIADVISTDMRALTKAGTAQARGDAWGPEPFVETQWLWVLLPVSLLLGTLLLICGTIIKSRRDRVPSWKSSALATLLHGLDEEVRGQFTLNASQSEVEAISQKLRVKMLLDDSSGRLVGV